MEELKYHYKYPHPCVTTDCVIFGFDGTKLNVLLIERGIEPFKGRWAFPGGFLKMDETALHFIWLCPVTLFVLGQYPDYMWIKPMNLDDDKMKELGLKD